MTDWKLPWSAHCRCERIEMRITEAPVITMACHCKGCQRMSASAFSLSILVPASGFAVVTGEPVIGGLHGDKSHHFHCDYCKSWMFTRPEGMDMVNVRASMLDDHAWYQPFVETSTAEKLPWATTGATHSFPHIPGNEAWGPLVAEFAQRRNR